MLVYLINIFLIIVWALIFCTGKRTRLKKWLYVGICFAQLYLISAYRYGIGSDYSQYAVGFFNMSVDGFSNMQYKDWEIGYILLNKIIGIWTAKPATFIMISSLFPLIGPAYLIGKYSVNPFMSVFLYVNLYLFYLDMNYIRQAIAMSILCFAFGFLRDKKFWRFLLIVAIAACFHLTALYMIPVYFVCMLRVNSRSLLLYLFGLLFYYILSDGLLNIILANFHTEYSGSIFIERGVYFYYSIFPLLLCAGMVVLSYFVKNKSRTLEVLIHLTLMMGFWQIVMTKHALFERFSYYTMLFVVLAVPEALAAFKKELGAFMKQKYIKAYHAESGAPAESKKHADYRIAVRKAEGRTALAVVMVAASVLILAFAYNMMGLIPIEKGVHGVLPYQIQGGAQLPSIDHWFK